MAFGFCPPFLRHLREIAGCATPQTKITPGGFLRFLLENRPNFSIENLNGLRLDDGDGHIRNVIIKYLKRALPEQTSTIDDCEINNINTYQEMLLSATNFRKKTFAISTNTMAQYCREASDRVGLTGFQGGVMREVWEQIMVEANALIGAIDKDLLGLMALRFGVNKHTNSNAAESVNFPNVNAGVNNDFDDGMTHILYDVMLNEMCTAGQGLGIVGSGNFFKYDIQRIAACCSQLGLDQSRFDTFNPYFDLYAQDIWGENQIGVFERGSVGLIELNRYEGFNSGQIGNSEFFSAPLPINCPQCNGNYDSMDFDIQVRSFDCPETAVICGVETNMRSGWAITISKNFGLFTLPTDAYQSTAYDDCYDDRLVGNNGTLRYEITND